MTRRTVLIAGAVAGLVLVMWYFLLWSPRKADLTEAKDQREKAEVLRDELTTRVARLRAAQKDEPMKRARVEALRTTIPDEPNLAAFILDTNDAAGKSGIDFISVAPSEPTAAAGTVATATPASVNTAGAPSAPAQLPAEINMSLQITGGYFQVLDFLNRVSEMPRLVITDGLNVNGDDKGKLTVSVTARMFVRSVPVEFGGAPVATTPPPNAAVSTPPAASTPPPTATAAPAVPANTSGARS